MIRVSIILIAIINLILPVPFASAQEVTWVTVEGEGSMEGVSKEEAKNRAIEDAVNKAIEEAAGGNISAETLVMNFKLSGGIIGAVPYIKASEKKLLEEGIINAHTEGRDKPVAMYKVKMKVGVVEKTTGSDFAFRLDSKLNQSSFKDGEEMFLKIKPTKDCYIAVFNIVEDGKIIRLIPNKFKDANFVKAGETFSFPDEADKKRGIKLKAHVPDSQKSVTETFYILALKKPFSFNNSKIQEGVFGFYNGQTAFMNDLAKEIVSIPLNERAEQLIQYQIKKK